MSTTITDLAGKVAIVTGGNSGIGAAVVLALAEAGAKVVIDYVAHPEATDAPQGSRSLPSATSPIGVDADISTVAGVQALVDAAVQTYGRLDIMVNNAGMETRTSVLETTEKQYDTVLAVNLKSAFFGVQLAAKREMIAQGSGGVIVNTSSVPRGLADARQRAVLPDQGRHADADADRRHRARGSGRAGRQRRARPGRHADQHGRDGQGHPRQARRVSRWAGWPRRRRSPASWCSRPATPRPT
ncbi:MAG: SDR family NAD(P)-dependent oxidoreductase [Candidatus Nanopelagicales bacterium]